MTVRGTSWALTVAAAILACGLNTGCQQAARPGPAAAVVSAKPAQVLTGGDQQAWLTAAGELGDSSYCAAKLQVPLNPKPDWEMTYTAAEIGRSTPQNMVHYNGTIICDANTSVIFGLSATTGKLLFKQDVYAHDPETRLGENFNALMFNSAGLLSGFDDRGRFYTWQVSPQGLTRLALSSESSSNFNGFVATKDSLVSGSTGGLLQSFALADFKRPQWESELMLPVQGVVARPDGTVVAWTQQGDIQCVEANGQPRWSVSEVRIINRIVLDRDQPLAYIVTDDGDLVCRQLSDGNELWRQNANHWISDEDVKQRIQRLHALLAHSPSFEQMRPFLRIAPSVLFATPDGPVLGLKNGLVLAFDRAGHLRWQSTAGPLINGGVAFQNAVLLHAQWQPPGNRSRYSELMWQLDPPDWPEITNRAQLQQLSDELSAPSKEATSFRAPPQRLRATYGRMVVLDMATGKVLQSLPEAQPSMAMLPAEGRLVMPLMTPNQSDVITGDANRLAEDMSARTCKIVAYNWLAQGS